MSALYATGALIVVLGVLVFVHEAGHFVAAKLAGIFVHRFSLGLGTPIPWLTFKRGGTEYSVSWLPLGGYVKMATKEGDATSSALEGKADDVEVPPESFFEAKPVWVRMIVILAGVFMNALFAWGAFSFLLAKNGVAVNPVTVVGRVVDSMIPPDAASLRRLETGDRIVAIAGTPVESWNEIVEQIRSAPGDSIVIEVDGKAPIVLPIHHDALDSRIRSAIAIRPLQPSVVGKVLPESPASDAGLAAGDTILSIAGTEVSQWGELVEVIERNAGNEIELVIVRGAERIRLAATPRPEEVTDPDGTTRTIGKLGFRFQPDLEFRNLSLGDAVVTGWDEMVNQSTLIVRAVRGMFSGRVSSREVGGPILIGQIAGEAARMGFDQFLFFMGIISINLAVLNLLPIPVLDGGQFLFLVAEGVLRRPLSLKLRERLTAVGLVMIVTLMGLAFWNDISRLLTRFLGG
jgi:regulator of sigma E protease